MNKRPLSRHLDVIMPVPPKPAEPEPERELCWKPVGEYCNCTRWEGHKRRCLATCGDCKEGRCHIPLRPPVAGVGDPTCGCDLHRDSLLAAKWDAAEETTEAKAVDHE